MHLLLILGLALPAAAMPLCHVAVEANTADSHAHHGEAEAETALGEDADSDPAAAPEKSTRHGCLGCALPWPQVDAPDMTPKIEQHRLAALPPFAPANPRPDVPPPRS